MSLIRVIGDSMEPTLGSGDIVLIDHSPRNYVDPHGGIDAIVVREEIMLKPPGPLSIRKSQGYQQRTVRRVYKMFRSPPTGPQTCSFAPVAFLRE